MKFNPSKFVTVLLWIVMIVLLICLGSLAFAADAPKFTKEQLQLAGKIKHSKSAIEQAKYYKRLYNSLKNNPAPKDPKIKALEKQKDKLDLLVNEGLEKYSLSMLSLFIETTVSIETTFFSTSRDDYEYLLKKEIANLEQIKAFIGRIRANSKMEKAFLFAKKSGVKIELSHGFKLNEQEGSLEINFKATDQKIVEFLLGPEEGKK